MDGDYTDYTTTITINNVAPTATFAHNGPANEGSTATVSFKSQFDPSPADMAAGFRYSYDFDNDGTFDVVDSLNPTATVPATYLSDGPGTRTVRARITDKDGGHNDYNTSISILNVAPTANLSGPTTGVRGQPRQFTFVATDPSSADQGAGFTFFVNWGDGSTEQLNGPSGSVWEHTFTGAGSFVIQVAAKDKDGGIGATASHTVAISAIALQGDTLVIGGTDANDIILVHPGGGRDGIKVHLNGAVQTFTDVERVVVFGQDGNDLIQVTESVTVPTELYGGDGNDILNGGGGPSMIMRGAGNDVIVGGKGRNLLIGGLGSDILTGLGGDDILIADDFMRGSRLNSQQETARNLLNYWNGSGTYANRVAGLKDDLVPLIFNDDATDLLLGGSGLDWFLADLTGSKKDILLNALFETKTNTRR
jgi:Ca2+-binding RTX toxin-like protein